MRHRILLFLLLFSAAFRLSVPGAIAAPDEEKAIILQAGIHLAQTQDWDKALLAAADIFRLHPHDPDAYQLMTLALYEKGHYNAVVHLVREAEMAGVESLFLYQKQAEAFFMLKVYEAALESLAKLDRLKKV